MSFCRFETTHRRDGIAGGFSYLAQPRVLVVSELSASRKLSSEALLSGGFVRGV
jgi:hypothetical protein